MKSLEGGDLAGGQHPRVTIGNQLISLTEVSCLWHNAHRENHLIILLKTAAETSACLSVQVCVHMYVFKNISPLCMH